MQQLTPVHDEVQNHPSNSSYLCEIKYVNTLPHKRLFLGVILKEDASHVGAEGDSFE